MNLCYFKGDIKFEFYIDSHCEIKLESTSHMGEEWSVYKYACKSDGNDEKFKEDIMQIPAARDMWRWTVVNVKMDHS